MAIIQSWYSNIYLALIIVGCILLISTFGSHTLSGVKGTIIGYSLIFFGLIMIIGYLLSALNSSSLWSMLTYNVGPFIPLLAILGYSLYLTSSYTTKISENQVPASYTTLSNISVLFIIAQLGIFYSGTSSKSFEQTGVLLSKYSMTMYLMATINIITLITLGIMLKYFSTDG